MAQIVPDLPVIAAFALAAVVLTFTPGPDMALFMARAIHYGRRHGLTTLAGCITGLMVHSLLAAFGISILIAAAPTAFLALKISGALYLLFLAIQALRSKGGLTLSQRARRVPSLRSSYLTGLTINLLNPKIILFFVTFLPQFVSPADPHAQGKLFFLGVEFIALAIPLTIPMVVGAEWLSRLLLRNSRIEKALNYSFAAVFAAFAVTILTAEGRN